MATQLLRKPGILKVLFARFWSQLPLLQGSRMHLFCPLGSTVSTDAASALTALENLNGRATGPEARGSQNSFKGFFLVLNIFSET